MIQGGGLGGGKYLERKSSPSLDSEYDSVIDQRSKTSTLSSLAHSHNTTGTLLSKTAGSSSANISQTLSGTQKNPQASATFPVNTANPLASVALAQVLARGAVERMRNKGDISPDISSVRDEMAKKMKGKRRPSIQNRVSELESDDAKVRQGRQALRAGLGGHPL
jgi:hypothetical protein